MDHIETEIFGQMVHADTLYFAWACMALIVVFSLFLVSGLNADTNKFGKRQFFAEGIFSFIRGLVRDQIGKKRGDSYVFFIGSIFIFILVNYYAGLLPWKMGALFEWWPSLPMHEVASHAAEHGHEATANAHHVGHPWHGASPCADINVPAAMALIVVLVYFLSGAMVGGFKYVQEFLPIKFNNGKISLNPMCLIEIMDLAVRPLTLSLRLFANTVAGETLLATFITLTVLVFPAFVLGFEMAVGLLQAFIFTILATVYIGTAVQHAEHLSHDHH
jgi:F-type H+-transporting ATPase subunit a